MTDSDYALENMYLFPDDIDEDCGTEDFIDQTQRALVVLAKFFKRLFEIVKNHANIIHMRSVVLKQRLINLQDTLSTKNGLLGNTMVLKISSNNDVFTAGNKSFSKIMELDRAFDKYARNMNAVFDWIVSDVPNIVRQLGMIVASFNGNVDDLLSKIGNIIQTKGTVKLARDLNAQASGNDAVTKPMLGSVSLCIKTSSKNTYPKFSLTKVGLETVPSPSNAGSTFTRFPVANARTMVNKLISLCDRVRDLHSARSINARMKDYQSLIDKLEFMGEAKSQDNNEQGLNVGKLDQIIDQIKTVMVWGAKTQDAFSAHSLRTIASIARLCRDNVSGKADTSID